jgi:hypothetical protein
MIPYDELCHALASWRERNGLANGPSARPPQGAVRTTPPARFGGEDTQLATEENVVEQQTSITINPLGPLAGAAPSADDAPTSLHRAAPEAVPEVAPAHESTQQLDLESDNVVLVDDDL